MIVQLVEHLPNKQKGLGSSRKRGVTFSYFLRRSITKNIYFVCRHKKQRLLNSRKRLRLEAQLKLTQARSLETVSTSSTANMQRMPVFDLIINTITNGFINCYLGQRFYLIWLELNLPGRTGCISKTLWFIEQSAVTVDVRPNLSEDNNFITHLHF